MTKDRPLYKRNLLVLWFGNFTTGVGISLVTPFLPLYIDTLGVFTLSELSFWSGVIIAAPFLMQIFVSPLWGRLADRKGRKLMLLRASLGMAIFMLASGFASNVWVLLALRVSYGLFSGYISNAVALIAVQVPRENSGKALGTLNTANVGGILIGPIFGGIVASMVGFAHVFFITGALLCVSFLLTLLFVKEDFIPLEKGQQGSVREVFAALESPRIIVSMFLATLIFMLTTSSINPILSLFVRDILPQGGNVEFWSGIIAAAPGVTMLFAAPLWGALADRVGDHKVLMAGLGVSAALFLPMVFVISVWQIVVLRLLLGISNAAMMPGIQAMLTRNSPREVTSRVFSFNQSAQAVGMVVGPLVGAAIGGLVEFRYVFLATMVFALINLLNVSIASHKKATHSPSTNK